MAGLRIDQADDDIKINGDEYLPAADGPAVPGGNRLPCKISTSQLAEYVLGLLKASGAEDFSTSGTVSWKTSAGALKFASGAQFARAIIAWAFEQAAVTNVEGVPSLATTDTFIVKQGNEEHVMSLAQLTTYLSNQITATIELYGMTSADALSGADLFLVAQGTDGAQTNKKVSLSTVRSFILNGIGAYLKDNSTLVNASGDTEQDPEFLFSYKGTTLRKWRLSSMIALAGDVHGPSSTTFGRVPQWSSTQKTLTDGLAVSTEISANSTDAQLPTAAAVKEYADNAVADRFPNGSATGNIPTYADANSRLGTGKSVTTSVAIATAAVDEKIPTEKAVRTAIDAERTYVDDNVKITVGTHAQGDLAKFTSDGRSVEGGLTATTEVSSTAVTASDSKLPTEKAVRAAIDAATSEGVAAMTAAITIRPVGSADNNHIPTESAVANALAPVVKTGLHADGEIPRFDGTGAQLKGGTALVTEVRAASNASDAAIATEKAVRTAVGVVQSALDNKKLDALAIPDAGTALDATTTRHGLMSASDKNKLEHLVDNTGVDEMGADLADGDTFLVHDDSRNAPRKSLLSRVWTYIASKLPNYRIDALSPAADNTDCDATTEHHGLLPKLLETHAGKYLRADGQWEQPPGSVDFRGATAEAAGIAGIVPAPALGVTNKFLQSNGQWGDPPIPVGASNIVFADIGNAPVLNDNAKVLTFDGSNYYLLKIGDFAHRWDTIWIPAGAMAPDSAAAAYADSVICAGNSTVRDCIRLGITRDSFCDFNLVLPDDFDPDSGIMFKLHWSSTGSAVQNHYVRFSLASLFSRPGDEMSASLGAEALVDDQILSGNANMLHVTDAAAIIPAGTYAKGANLHFRLGRLYTTFTPSSGTKCAEQVYLLGMQVRICRRADGISSPSQQEAW